MTKELQDLLMGLYDLMWNEVATYDSDVEGYSQVTWDDQLLIENQCLAIERQIAAEKYELSKEQ